MKSGRVSVLLVVDDTAYATQFGRILATEGMTCRHVVSLNDALAALGTPEHLHDIVVMDHVLIAGGAGADPATRFFEEHDNPIIMIGDGEEGIRLPVGMSDSVYGVLARSSGDRIIVAALMTARRLFCVHREQKRQLRDVTEREESYRAIFSTAREGMMLTAPDGRIFAANEAACVILGVTEEDICSNGRAAWVDDADRRLEALLEERRQTGTASGDLTMRRGNGETFPAGITSTIFRIKGGEERSGIIFHDASERISHEQLLREQHDLIRGVLDGFRGPVFSLDTNLRYTSFNAVHENEMKEQFGARIASGCCILDYLPPEIRGRVTGVYRKVLGGEMVTDHLSLNSRLLGMRIFEMSHVPIRKQGGDVVGIGVIGRDQTDQIAAQQALEQSEAHARALMDSLPETVFEYDRKGRLTFVNATGHSVLGYTDEDFANGVTALDVIAPAFREFARVTLTKLLTVGGETRNEYEAITKNGMVLPVTVHSRAITTSEGIVGIRGVMVDNTEARRVESQLQLLSHAIEASPVSVVITNLAGRIEYVNPAFTRATGYGFDEVHGRNPRILKSGRFSHSQYEEMWRTILGGNEWEGEFHNRRKSGEFFWEHAWISPVRNSAGEVTHFVALKEDITNRKQLEESLVQSDKMASIGQLTAGIAHEINNPLSYVLNNLERFEEYFVILRTVEEEWRRIALAGGSDGAAGMLCEGAYHLEKKSDLEFVIEDFGILMGHAKEGTLRIKRIVEQLRGFSHNSEDGYSSASLEGALEDSVLMVWNEIKYKVNVKKDFELLTPVICNIGELKQVFVNLLMNAAHAIDVSGDVVLRTSRAGDSAIVEVSDTGKGISQEHLGKIFDPFFTTKPVGKGTGLGLWISATIIDKHKGKISVTSTVGSGTTFRISLPMTQPEELTHDYLSVRHNA